MIEKPFLLFFKNNDVLTVEPSPTEDLDQVLGSHPSQYSLCSSSRSSQANIYCSQNFTGILGRVWPFQITPGNADIICSCQKVKMNIFGYLFKINKRCCGAAAFPKLFSNFIKFSNYCQVHMPKNRQPQLLKAPALYCIQVATVNVQKCYKI